MIRYSWLDIIVGELREQKKQLLFSKVIYPHTHFSHLVISVKTCCGRTPSQFPSPTVLSRSIPFLAYLHPFPQVSLQSETGISPKKMLSEIIVVVPRKHLAQNHHDAFLQTIRQADNFFRCSNLLIPEVDIYIWKQNTTSLYIFSPFSRRDKRAKVSQLPTSPQNSLVPKSLLKVLEIKEVIIYFTLSLSLTSNATSF